MEGPLFYAPVGMPFSGRGPVDRGLPGGAAGRFAPVYDGGGLRPQMLQTTAEEKSTTLESCSGGMTPQYLTELLTQTN